MSLKNLLAFLAVLTISFSTSYANADLFEFEFWGEADPPGQGQVLAYDGVVFGDNPEAHGLITYDTTSNEVTRFWIDIPTLAGGLYHFENATGYNGTYIPRADEDGPIAGDGDWFFVGGDMLDLEFERYYDESTGWYGNYLIQDSSDQFSIGGQGARAVAPNAVPLPSAALLVFSGLGLVFVSRKPKK